MSIIKQEKLDTNTIKLEIEVGAAQFEDVLAKVFVKQRKNITVPGFRKGKAPRMMVERLYGESVFFEDAVNESYIKALSDAVEEAGIEPVAAPEIEILDVSKEKGYTFNATCTVKPEVKIENYKGIKVKKIVKTPTDEDINNVIEDKRKQAGRLVVSEDRAAETGDLVTFDFEGFVDEKPFEGGKAENFDLELGSGRFIPGFEEQLVGKNTGEEFDISVTFPEDYHNEELKGKEAVFKCKLNEIKYNELPELDDEFAKDVSEFDTLEEFKENVKTDLENQHKQEAENDADRQVNETISGLLQAEIPPVMIENTINDNVRDFENSLRMQGMDIARYCEYIGKSQNEFKEQFRERSETQVKLSLAYEKIAELENIEITQDKIDAEYKRLAEEYKMDEGKVRIAINEKELKNNIAKNEALEFVKSNSEISEEIPE